MPAKPDEEFFYFPEVPVNGELVKALMFHLLRAMYAFADSPEAKGINWVDILMGAHNFHSAVIVDILDAHEGNTLWIDAAAGTFAQRMKREKDRRSVDTAGKLSQ